MYGAYTGKTSQGVYSEVVYNINRKIRGGNELRDNYARMAMTGTRREAREEWKIEEERLLYILVVSPSNIARNAFYFFPSRTSRSLVQTLARERGWI